MQVPVTVPLASEAQKTTKETPGKKGESVIVPAPQKPVAPVTPNKIQEPAVAKVRIAPVQKTAISPPVKRWTRAAESAGIQDTTNEPVRVIEKKPDDGSADSMYNEALREQQSGRTREAKTIYKQILAKTAEAI